jgi:cytochrome c556
MRRFVSRASVLAIVWVMAAVVAAQGKPELDNLNRVMKKAGPVQQVLVKALVAGDAATARTQLATLKGGIVDAQKFWTDNKRTDAVDVSKTVVKKIDALDKLLSAPALDSTSALAAIKDLNQTCNECHKVYRATDDDGHFILKPGSVPGF